ncbi:MAG: restriction endonuclease, partial [Salinivirgaceae bacterium]|nr:restriction endonuclease [Salinivirgaceae bacterium]
RTGEENVTYEKIKQTLLDLKIPENQIRIKTADINEIKDEDLLSPQCPVRYIITVNALKEGWDCPFAYVLASLADKSSAVDVEQILGRVLRLPWVRRNNNAMLNMSYVLTASNKFLDTLDNIVKGLTRAGFSEKDYRMAEPEKPKQESQNDIQVVQHELDFDNKQKDIPPITDDDFDASKIKFAPVVEADTQGSDKKEVAYSAEKPSLTEEINSDVAEIERLVKVEVEKEAAVEATAAKQERENVPNELEKQVKTYKMKDVFSESAKSLKLPQFMSEDKSQELTGNLFVELHESALFESEMLLRDFKLGSEDSNINFDSIETSLYRVDLDEHNNYLPTYLKIEGSVHEDIVNYILDPKQKDNRVKNCTYRLKNIIGKMYPIPDKEIELYISHVLERFTDEQFTDLMNHEYSYADKIKEKIKQLGESFKEKQFKNMVDKDLVFTADNWTLPTEILPTKTISGIPKSLYEKEGDIDGFEREVINDVANLENVEFWTRNLERGKGFCINGFINHYPDFIIKTKKGKIVILETKGDHLDAEKKIYLGNLWASKAGNNYRYCLVYKNREVEGAYTKTDFIDKLKGW